MAFCASNLSGPSIRLMDLSILSPLGMMPESLHSVRNRWWWSALVSRKVHFRMAFLVDTIASSLSCCSVGSRVGGSWGVNGEEGREKCTRGGEEREEGVGAGLSERGWRLSLWRESRSSCPLDGRGVVLDWDSMSDFSCCCSDAAIP